jgi:hypothetical protein
VNSPSSIPVLHYPQGEAVWRYKSKMKDLNVLAAPAEYVACAVMFMQAMHVFGEYRLWMGSQRRQISR